VTARAAAFLDRDGTLIEDRHYLADARDVMAIPRAVAAVRLLNARGVPVIVITNQSGIARGRFTSETYVTVERRVHEVFASQGASILATYHCPHGPDDGCACRKPRVALYEQAAADHGLDLSISLFAGDRLRDVEPVSALGGTGVLVLSPHTPADERDAARARFAIETRLDEAVRQWLGE